MTSIYQFLRGELTTVTVQDNSAGASVAADVLTRSSALVLSGSLSSERPLYLPHRAGLVVVVKNGCTGAVRIKGSPGETGVAVPAGDTVQVVSANNAWSSSGSGGSSFDLHGLTSKPTPVGADEVVLADSAASWAQKKSTVTALLAALGVAGGDVDGLLSALTVRKIQGRSVSTTAPQSGEAYVWSASGGGSWVPSRLSSIRYDGSNAVLAEYRSIKTVVGDVNSVLQLGTIGTGTYPAEGRRLWSFRSTSVTPVGEEFPLWSLFGGLLNNPGVACELDAIVKFASSTTANHAKILFSVGQNGSSLAITNRVNVALNGMASGTFAFGSSGTALSITITPESVVDQYWSLRLRALATDVSS